MNGNRLRSTTSTLTFSRPSRDSENASRNSSTSGILVMPYINAMSADMDIPDWGHFAPAAIMDQAGGLHMWNYSDRSGRLLSMCPTQRVWQSAIVKTVDDLVAGEGVNGVYLDQISAMPNELCFNTKHGHPLGGGRHWADGYRELLRQVRNVSQRNGRRTVITSEGVNEIFFDLLDANLEYAQPNDREIPMLEVVYSGYTLFFASPCDYRKSDRYFRFAEGRPFLDGRQIGWMNTSFFAPERAAKAAFFKECARYRVAARKFSLMVVYWSPCSRSTASRRSRTNLPAYQPCQRRRVGKLTRERLRLPRADCGNPTTATWESSWRITKTTKLPSATGSTRRNMD